VVENKTSFPVGRGERADNEDWQKEGLKNVWLKEIWIHDTHQSSDPTRIMMGFYRSTSRETGATPASK
jgi:hypothetical protein